MIPPPIRRADPIGTVVLAGEDDEQPAREHLDEQAAAAGRAWLTKPSTNLTTTGYKDWSFKDLVVLSAGETGAARGACSL